MISVYGSTTNTIVARYVFDIAVITTDTVSAVSLGALETQFRAHLLRICTLHTNQAVSNKNNEEELAFGFVLYTKGVRPGQNWIPATTEIEARTSKHLGAVPLKDADKQSDTAILASRIEIPFNG